MDGAERMIEFVSLREVENKTKYLVQNTVQALNFVTRYQIRCGMIE
jgi:hypothetical protein